MKQIESVNAHFDITIETSSNLADDNVDPKPVDISGVAQHCHIVEFKAEPILKSDCHSQESAEDQIKRFIDENNHYRIQLWFDYENKSTLTKLFLKDLEGTTPNMNSRFLYEMNIKMKVRDETIQTISFIGHSLDAMELIDEDQEKYITVMLFTYRLYMESGEKIKKFNLQKLLEKYKSETVQ